MLGKQLNFLKIFDEENKDKKKPEEAEGGSRDPELETIPEEVKPEASSEGLSSEAKSVVKSEVKPEEINPEINSEAEKIKTKQELEKTRLEIQEQLEKEKLKAKLLLPGYEPSLEEFEPFIEEIKKYQERYQQIEGIFQKSASGKEKMRAYELLTFPDYQKYLESGKLLIKYEDALKREQLRIANESAEEKNKPVSGPESKNINKVIDDDDDLPDPYGDIYPYSRRFRKKR